MPGQDSRQRGTSVAGHRHHRQAHGGVRHRHAVRIDNIARLRHGFGPTRITRTNRQFSISFSGDVAPGTRSMGLERHARPDFRHCRRAATRAHAGQTRNGWTTDNLLMAMALASVFVSHGARPRSSRASAFSRSSSWWCCHSSVPFALFTIWATGKTLCGAALGILLLFGIVKEELHPGSTTPTCCVRKAFRIRQALEQACQTPAPDPHDDAGHHRRPDSNGTDSGLVVRVRRLRSRLLWPVAAASDVAAGAGRMKFDVPGAVARNQKFRVADAPVPAVDARPSPQKRERKTTTARHTRCSGA